MPELWLRFLSLQAIALGETKALHFRAEMFNIFNIRTSGYPTKQTGLLCCPQAW